MSNTATRTVLSPTFKGTRHSGVLATAFDWMGRAKQRRMLKDLDQDRLDDIGLTRAQALEEAAKPFWQS